MALDELMKQRINRGREDGRYHGSGFASDESPPNCNKYVGLRFQVTWLYNLWFAQPSTWDTPCYDDAYPFQREKVLCDIVNAPGKTGTDTLKIIEGQVARKGVYRDDLVAGVGDGGGENEGLVGVHGLLTAANPSYAKHRCMPHFSWRTFWAGTALMMPHLPKSNKMNSYLHRGTTWTRLASIAVQPPASRGLGMFAENSKEYKEFFSKAPPKLIDGRPEAHYEFIVWLLKRQGRLKLMVECDLATRTLDSDEGIVALETLTDRTDCIYRFIDAVLMHKAMFLFYWTKGKQYLAAHTMFGELIERALDVMTSTRLTDDVLEVLQLTRADVIAAGLVDDAQMHWVEVVMVTIPLPSAEVDARLPEAVKYHQRISLAMAAHCKLTAENIARHYMPGAILAKDAELARTASRLFHEHLLRTPTHAQTPLEQTISGRNVLMVELGLHCDLDPPAVLWRGNGLFKNLFFFLAVRFLSCPDSVLDAEGVHALWKWVESTKRNMSFKFLNALLKTQCYLRDYAAFPEPGEINPLLMEINSGMLAQFAAARSDPAIASGLSTASVYAHRFNLRAADVDLIKAVVRANAPVSDSSPTQAWSNYIRFALEDNQFYALENLSSDIFFLVIRTRAAPGKDAPDDADAHGRAMALAWFSREREDLDGIHVKPMAGKGDIHVVDATVAEISRGCGYYPAALPDDTTRAVELKHESMFMRHGLVHYQSLLSTDAEHPWNFVLSTPTNVETRIFNSRGIADLTKMALARHLQLLEGTSDVLRDTHWGMTKEALLVAIIAATDGGGGVGHVPAAPAVAAAAAAALVAAAKAKAKGKIAAKGLAKGKAKAKAKAKAKGKG
jgi:hypothetical protein